MLLGACAAALLTPSPTRAAEQITLTGAVTPNCTITATADPNASNLLLTDGAQHVTIGTLAQSCNKKAGYTIAVTSTNCATAPAGGKLLGSAGGETLAYSVESHNPTTGGSSATVTGLIASSCTGQNARSVANAKISGETSTIFVNYTGNSGLGADTYQDVITFTMNVN
jgi:hypothetical protein